MLVWHHRHWERRTSDPGQKCTTRTQEPDRPGLGPPTSCSPSGAGLEGLGPHPTPSAPPTWPTRAEVPQTLSHQAPCPASWPRCTSSKLPGGSLPRVLARLLLLPRTFFPKHVCPPLSAPSAPPRLPITFPSVAPPPAGCLSPFICRRAGGTRRAHRWSTVSRCHWAFVALENTGLSNSMGGPAILQTVHPGVPVSLRLRM